MFGNFPAPDTTEPSVSMTTATKLPEGLHQLRRHVVHRMPVVPVTVENVLVHHVALLRIQLPGELLGQLVQGLLHGHAHRRPSGLLLPPVEHDLVAFQDRQ